MNEIYTTTPYKEILLKIITSGSIAQLHRDNMSIDFCTPRKIGEHSLLTIKLVINPDAQFIIKMSRHLHSDVARHSIIQEYENLSNLRTEHPDSGLFPSPVSLTEIMELPVLIMPYIASTELHHMFDATCDPQTATLNLGKCTQALIDLQSIDSKNHRLKIDLAFIQRYVEEPFKHFSLHFPEPASQIALYLEKIKTSLSESHGKTLPVVREHGDFNPYNINLKSDGSLLILDWEDAQTAGLPLMDLLNNILITFRLLKQSDPENGGRINTFIKFANQQIIDYCQCLEIDPGLRDLLTIIYLLRSTCFFLTEKRQEKEYSQSWWYLLQLGFTENIFISCLDYENEHWG